MGVLKGVCLGVAIKFLLFEPKWTINEQTVINNKKALVFTCRP